MLYSAVLLPYTVLKQRDGVPANRERSWRLWGQRAAVDHPSDGIVEKKRKVCNKIGLGTVYKKKEAQKTVREPITAEREFT
mgnify:CR=1 FL=1